MLIFPSFLSSFCLCWVCLPSNCSLEIKVQERTIWQLSSMEMYGIFVEGFDEGGRGFSCLLNLLILMFCNLWGGCVRIEENIENLQVSAENQEDSSLFNLN